MSEVAPAPPPVPLNFTKQLETYAGANTNNSDNNGNKVVTKSLYGRRMVPPPPLPENFVETERTVFVHPDGTQMTAKELIPGRVYTSQGMFTKSTCQEWIAKAESHGWIQTPIRGGAARNNKKSEWEDKDLSRKIFEACNCDKIVPKELPGGRKLWGLGNKVRIYCYGAGEYFAPHWDGGAKVRQDDDRWKPAISTSVFTLVIYLNDGFKGGATRILNAPEWDAKPRDIIPVTGGALMFRQEDVEHEGCIINEGVKYIMHLNVMYTPAAGKEMQAPPLFELSAADSVNIEALRGLIDVDAEEQARKERDLIEYDA